MKKPNVIKYAIFDTLWGYFGLAGTNDWLMRTHLPNKNPQLIKTRLLKGLPTVRSEQDFLGHLQLKIIAYFEGKYINFQDTTVFLEDLTPLAEQVLTASKDVQIGQTMAYSALAKKVCRPSAARTIGTIMAKNPLPLIIPCHRVIRSDGKIGGFSAAGGIAMKKKLLNHEKRWQI